MQVAATITFPVYSLLTTYGFGPATRSNGPFLWYIEPLGSFPGGYVPLIVSPYSALSHVDRD